jgi:hypothetical protein
MAYVARLFWAVSMIAALAGGFYGTAEWAFSGGNAPRTAAGAAFGLLIAGVPYFFARSIDELTRPRST